MAWVYFLLRCLLYMRGGHTQDLTPSAPPEFGSHHTVHAGTDRISGLVNKNAGIVVEADDTTVGALDLLPGTDDNSVSDITSLHLVRG